MLWSDLHMWSQFPVYHELVKNYLDYWNFSFLPIGQNCALVILAAHFGLDAKTVGHPANHLLKHTCMALLNGVPSPQGRNAQKKARPVQHGGSTPPFLAATTQATCKAHLEKFLSLCDDIGVPTAPDKTTEPATNTVFLGIELDTIQQSAKLPLDKFRDYSATIHAILDHDKVQRKTLESIVGKLSFAASVVPARPFLQRLIDLVYTVKKPYYQIRITKQVKQDLLTWLEFLSEYNGITFFRYGRSIDSTTIHLVSDACKYGFGGCYGRKWIQGHYPNDWQQYHITILELFPIYLLTSLFGHLMANSTIVYHCDNQAMTDILNKQSSKNQLVMGLVHPLVLTLIKHNIMLMSQHIPGKNNILADRISRFQVTPALLTHYNMEKQPTAVPAHLLPGRFTITCWQCRRKWFGSLVRPASRAPQTVTSHRKL